MRTNHAMFEASALYRATMPSHATYRYVESVRSRHESMPQACPHNSLHRIPIRSAKICLCFLFLRIAIPRVGTPRLHTPACCSCQLAEPGALRRHRVSTSDYVPDEDEYSILLAASHLPLFLGLLLPRIVDAGGSIVIDLPCRALASGHAHHHCAYFQQLDC